MVLWYKKCIGFQSISDLLEIVGQFFFEHDDHGMVWNLKYSEIRTEMNEKMATRGIDI
jgi:hypothetical protein